MNVFGRRLTHCAGRPHAHAIVEPNRSLWSALNRSAAICAAIPGRTTMGFPTRNLGFPR